MKDEKKLQEEYRYKYNPVDRLSSVPTMYSSQIYKWCLREASYFTYKKFQQNKASIHIYSDDITKIIIFPARQIFWRPPQLNLP